MEITKNTQMLYTSPIVEELKKVVNIYNSTVSLENQADINQLLLNNEEYLQQLRTMQAIDISYLGNYLSYGATIASFQSFQYVLNSLFSFLTPKEPTQKITARFGFLFGNIQPMTLTDMSIYFGKILALQLLKFVVERFLCQPAISDLASLNNELTRKIEEKSKLNSILSNSKDKVMLVLLVLPFEQVQPFLPLLANYKSEIAGSFFKLIDKLNESCDKMLFLRHALNEKNSLYHLFAYHKNYTGVIFHSAFGTETKTIMKLKSMEEQILSAGDEKRQVNALVNYYQSFH